MLCEVQWEVADEDDRAFKSCLYIVDYQTIGEVYGAVVECPSEWRLVFLQRELTMELSVSDMKRVTE